jgi:hypothetical protein
MMGEHYDGDDCAVYGIEDELRVIGFENPVIADDIEVGDFIQDPLRDDPNGLWFEVQETWSEPGEQSMHIFVAEATRADLHQAWTDILNERACQGS